MSTATVIVVREQTRADGARSYTVLVDGERTGRVRNGETATFDVEPGEHRVRVKIDWTGSPTRSFVVGPGEIATFACWPTRNGLRRVVLAIAGVRRTINLSQVPDDAAGRSA